MQKFSSFGRKKKQTKIRHRMVMLRRLQLLTKIRGTKRLVSVNICLVEGNSAGIFVSKVYTWNFRNENKMNAYYFRRDKTAVWVRLKPSYHFRKANISC